MVLYRFRLTAGQTGEGPCSPAVSCCGATRLGGTRALPNGRGNVRCECRYGRWRVATDCKRIHAARRGRRGEMAAFLPQNIKLDTPPTAPVQSDRIYLLRHQIRVLWFVVDSTSRGIFAAPTSRIDCSTQSSCFRKADKDSIAHCRPLVASLTRGTTRGWVIVSAMGCDSISHTRFGRVRMFQASAGGIRQGSQGDMHHEWRSCCGEDH